MYLIVDEKDMLDIVESYGDEHCAVFTFSKKGKSVDVGGGAIDMLKLPIMPDEDTINGIKSHGLSRKKVFAAAEDAIKHPEKDDGDASLCMAMCQMLFMMGSDRHDAPNILIFVRDPLDEERNEFLSEYVKRCFKVFGLGKTKVSDVEDVLRTRKSSKKNKPEAVAARMHDLIEESEDCHLSEKGITRKKKLMLYYEIPLRQINLAAAKDGTISSGTIKGMVKCLMRTYTGRNLKHVTSDRFGKVLSERNKAAVKAYKSLRDILGDMKNSIDLPKVKYGFSKDDYGDPDEPKMDEKKFSKFFMKDRNAPLVILIYAHTTLVMSGDEVGDDSYNKRMKAIVKMFDSGDGDNSFEKDFMASVASHAKRRR